MLGEGENWKEGDFFWSFLESFGRGDPWSLAESCWRKLSREGRAETEERKKNPKCDSLFWKRRSVKNRIGFGEVTYREGTVKTVAPL